MVSEVLLFTVFLYTYSEIQTRLPLLHLNQCTFAYREAATEDPKLEESEKGSVCIVRQFWGSWEEERGSEWIPWKKRQEDPSASGESLAATLRMW